MQAPWIFSCNTKMFDIDKHFAENSTVVWKSRGAKKDDIVYLYLSAPTKEIRYRCHVVEDNIPDNEMVNYQYAITDKYTLSRPRYVKLAFDKAILAGEITRDDLKENGVNQVQAQARICRQAVPFFLKKDPELKDIWKDN